jgi:hypothetical protein
MGSILSQKSTVGKDGHVSVLKAALHWHDRGLWIVPTNEKGAFWRDWQSVRRSRDELIKGLRGTNHGIALVLNQTPWVDIECDSGKAEAALRHLFGETIPRTPTWQSRRGKHRLFMRPDGLPEAAKLEIEGIEFRIGNKRGACSVLPPSGVRRWLPDLDLDDLKPAELPESIAALLRKPAQANESEPSANGNIPEGQRNDTLFKAACKLFREGHSADDVKAMAGALNLTHCRPPLVTKEVVRIVESAAQQVENAKGHTDPYSVQEGRIVRESRNNDSSGHIPLCNFTAQIVQQVFLDDGVESSITFEVEGRVANGPALPRVEVPSADFAAMGWVAPSWGTAAVVYAGLGTKDHLRAAIQLISGDVPVRTVFGHTGWRKVDGGWVYLHAGGAVGAQGTVSTAQVSLPGNLDRFLLPDPPKAQELQEGIHASLRLIDLAPEPITSSILGAVYRAVLGPADFSVHLAGPTGAGKTELAALAQQHFGGSMDARHLPGSWSSTANSLETLAFHVKDALLVVDDFAPHGTVNDVAHMHKEADRLIRAQGNRSGRGRCRPDGSLRPAKPPRGLILSTGEDIPKGQSLRARQWVLELCRSEISWEKITRAQHDAAEGKYSAALAGYIQWLAPRIGAICQVLRSKTFALRAQLRGSGQHARTPGIAADLLFGWSTFLDFALDVGAISAVGRSFLLYRVCQALLSVASRQSAHGEASEPASHFMRLVVAGLASGEGHVAASGGGAPPYPFECWGWEADQKDGTPRSRGRKIGWLKGSALYLEPEASYAMAQELARKQGEGLSVSPQTLRKRLHEKGYLASTETGKLTNRRVLEGIERSILHLDVASL